jgi:hypothetical protein
LRNQALEPCHSATHRFEVEEQEEEQEEEEEEEK